LSTGGPGATHLLTGLYDAKLDHAPVLAICGQAEATVRGGQLPARAQPRPHVRGCGPVRTGSLRARSGKASG
jgi:thiamine pyrophosphate-dependent acetolactate synthase large subunit-like protein